MMAAVQPFYVPDGHGRFASTTSTAGPWDHASQHGGPPAALLARAVEHLDREGPRRLVGRFTMELLGPVPVGPVSVEAAVVRPGRSVEMCEATLVDEQRGRACARGTAWLFPAREDGPEQPSPLPHSHVDGAHKERPPVWLSGYMDAIDWRWVEGAVSEPGPGTVWMRPLVDLVEGESMSPVQRLLTCVDSASGISSVLDLADWRFLNTELSVHLLREPVGDWVCVAAETTLSSGSIGTAVSRVYDDHGLVARSAQALLVVRR